MAHHSRQDDAIRPSEGSEDGNIDDLNDILVVPSELLDTTEAEPSQTLTVLAQDDLGVPCSAAYIAENFFLDGNDVFTSYRRMVGRDDPFVSDLTSFVDLEHEPIDGDDDRKPPATDASNMALLVSCLATDRPPPTEQYGSTIFSSNLVRHGDSKSESIDASPASMFYRQPTGSAHSPMEVSFDHGEDDGPTVGVSGGLGSSQQENMMMMMLLTSSNANDHTALEGQHRYHQLSQDTDDVINFILSSDDDDDDDISTSVPARSMDDDDSLPSEVHHFLPMSDRPDPSRCAGKAVKSVTTAVPHLTTNRSPHKKQPQCHDDGKVQRVRKRPPQVKTPVTLREVDCVCERGGFSKNHPGTTAYRTMVGELLTRYRYSSLSTKDKTALSNDVVDWVHNTQRGRFVARDRCSQTGIHGPWYVVARDTARQKASQILRDQYKKKTNKEKLDQGKERRKK